VTPSIRLLIVEDARIVARGLEKRLQKMGYTVLDLAVTGEEAVEKAGLLRPDLIFMDINLGDGIDGIEAAQRIRAQFGLPIIFLTAHSDESTLERAKLSEPFGYVLKPYEDRALQSAIEIGLTRHKLETRVRQSEQWLAATLGSIGDGLVAVDAEGRIRMLNATAEKTFGRLNAEVQGQPIQEVCLFKDEETGEMLENPVQKLLATQVVESRPRIVNVVARNGQHAVIEYTASIIWELPDQPSGAVLLFRDISDKRRLERRLREEAEKRAALIEDLKLSNQHLQQLNEQKNTLLGMAAHDLRNPLSVILGYSKFLQINQKDVLGAQPMRFIQNIERSTRNMLALVDDLLDVSSLEAGQLILNLSRFDLRDLVDQVVRTNRPLADAKNIVLKYRPPEKPLMIEADNPKLEQVLTNLVTNAIKYSPAHSQAEVQMERLESEIMLTVKDQGPGIPHLEQAKLFQPFGQTSVKPTAGEKSTGLGLAIARRIVEGHQGKIGLISQPGQGSTFWFRLPFQGGLAKS
jgi:two-component system cell cycle sensor histidine kinase/response regulator CckA